MADSFSGDGSNQVSLSVSTQEKGSRNKRKYLAEFSLDIPIDLNSLTLTEFPRYELLAEKFQHTLSDIGSLEARSDWPEEEKEEEEKVEEFQPADWDDPIASQLEELLSRNLCATFQSAIKKIVECGYSDEVAEWAVLRSGLYYGSKDPVSNIVDGALVFLRREKEFDTSRHHVFEDLQNLVEYTILEMICVLREVKPSLTVAEAMWWLLICDLNLSLACAVGGDPLSGFGGKEVPGKSSSDSAPPQLKSEGSETVLSNSNKPHISEPKMPSAQDLWSDLSLAGGIPNLPNPKNFLVREVTTKEKLVSVPDTGGKSFCVTEEHVQIMSQTFSIEEKSGGSRKGRSGNSKRDMHRQKSLHLEKTYKGVSKGTFKAKLTTWGGLVVDKKLKSPSDSSGVNMKSTSSKTSTAVGANSPLANGNHNSSNTPSVLPATETPATLPAKDTVSALPAAHTKLSTSLPPETKPTPKPQVSNPNSPKTPDYYYTGIPYDKSMGKYVPQDEKDETILTLVPRLQPLQKELQGWTDWANEKVMQAARRLSKDQAELKTLRQEKEETEKFKKEKQILEESTMKRLSEMECALANATGQVEMANSTVRRLEEESSVLKKDMEAAGLQALRSAANLQDALLREQEALKKAQSWDVQKGLLQEEFTTDKHKVAELQQEVEKAKGLSNRIQARCKQEERDKEKLQKQASSIRREREQLEALAKAQEDMIRQKAENELQKYKEDIKKIESKLSELRLESESSKIAALRRGIHGSYGSCLTESESAPALQGYQSPRAPKRLAVFRDNFGAGSVRECVMCLTDEMSVVFLPCAHQVLCTECNELHEKQRMKDCPSCRTPIQRRINVRFASP